MNNKKVPIKITSAIFLATVLVLGTIATISPSFMVGAQAEPYYGIENDYKKSNGKDVSVKYVKCNNINVNVNGLELTALPSFLSDSGLAAESQDANTDASSFAGNSDASEINDFRFICINNNNNVVVEEPLQPLQATLNVIKLVTCQESTNDLIGISIQQAPGPCDRLENLITENQYLFNVINDNPVPSQFAGSESGTVVTLGPGNYVVIETRTTSVDEDILTLLQDPSIESINIQAPIFTGDCTEIVPGDRATGTIRAGESQTCNIVNNFVVNVE